MTFKDKPGYIYIAETGDRSLVKIGFTTCPEDRAAGLRNSTHYNGGLRLLLYFEGTWRDEQDIHARLVECRRLKGREWYQRSALLIQQFVAENKSRWRRWKFTPRPRITNQRCKNCGLMFRRFGKADKWPICGRKCHSEAADRLERTARMNSWLKHKDLAA